MSVESVIHEGQISIKARTYRHSWKRMDDGSETVLAYGNFVPQKATAP
ncbi:hypothetical protein UFOVP1196_55 [uncultured Caudovirales phage]|uniref:Uncharacterized protein n=1 Tax=uncultured Caudovirales phage TaxID=2100421 RepID=A0A6J5R372_9CAUD|nr:hypothetical protein UFOVP1196_55 [uncultured Caudovirales phage]